MPVLLAGFPSVGIQASGDLGCRNQFVRLDSHYGQSHASGLDLPNCREDCRHFSLIPTVFSGHLT
jgi:hypothetical protein